MKRLSILTLLLLVASQVAFAQRTSTVSAVAIDDKTAEKINGAVLKLTSVADTTVEVYGLANSEGKIVIQSVPYGDYTAKIGRMGYEDRIQKLTVNAKTTDLGTFLLKESAIELDEVTVSGLAMRTSQHGDTLIYNASAFKVSPDADADELLKKLPGVTVNKDGTVTAQGETVQKMLVDGKEFYGTDVTATMKNIPARVIEKVETFRKLSDFSENTGINDGNDYMAMNLVTNMKYGQNGRFLGGYNFQDKYDLTATYSIFGGPHFLNLTGSSNNTGTMNFGGNSGFGAGIVSMSGGGRPGMRIMLDGVNMGSNNKTTTHSVGMNYNYEKSEKFKANLNYRYGYRDSESKSSSEIEYFDPRLSYDKRYSSSNGSSTNEQHTVGGRIQWKISDKQDFSFRPNLRFRNAPSTSFSRVTDYQTTGGIEELFRDISNTQTNSSDQYNLSAAAQYTVRLNKPGRSFNIELTTEMNKDDGDNFRNSTYVYLAPKPDSLGRSTSISHTKTRNMGASATYVEPITQFWSLTANYFIANNLSDRNSNTLKWDFDTEKYVPWDENSNIMNTSELIQRMGPGINYTRNRDMVNVNFFYQRTLLKGERTMPTPAYDSRATFEKLVYNASFRKSFNSENSLEFRTNSSTRNPTIAQLQDVDNVNNAPYFSGGNSKLTPSNSYDNSLRYTRTSLKHGYTFSASASLNLSYNNIGDSTIIVTDDILTDDSWRSPNGTLLKKGDQYSRSVNIGSGLITGGLVSFGMPLTFIKSNFNVSASYRYRESDSYFNGKRARVYKHSLGPNVGLSTNFSEKFSANLSYYLDYSLSQYSATDQKDYAYLTQRLSFDLMWITWKDFVIATDISYGVDKGLTDDYSFANTICNISLGKKIFKNKRGEVSLTVHDLFNQNKQFSRTVTHYSIENRTENLVQRFFTINFSYTLRSINADKAPQRGQRIEMRRPGESGPPLRISGERFM